jgi:hypothetical protein
MRLAATRDHSSRWKRIGENACASHRRNRSEAGARHPAVITEDLPNIYTSIASDNPLVAGEAELREPRALPSETW